jgi:hypothetical protein
VGMGKKWVKRNLGKNSGAPRTEGNCRNPIHWTIHWHKSGTLSGSLFSFPCATAFTAKWRGQAFAEASTGSFTCRAAFGFR